MCHGATRLTIRRAAALMWSSLPRTWTTIRGNSLLHELPSGDVYHVSRLRPSLTLQLVAAMTSND